MSFGTPGEKIFDEEIQDYMKFDGNSHLFEPLDIYRYKFRNSGCPIAEALCRHFNYTEEKPLPVHT